MKILVEFFKRLFDSPSTEELEKNAEPRWKVTKKVFETIKKHIICNGEPVEIEWHKVILWNEEGGLKSEPSQYKKRNKDRNLKMFIVHWDACLSSLDMSKILKDRGLSVAFAIDNDGTIYQLMDTKHVAWHARGVNTISVGVEITNAVLLKYQDWYVKHGFGKRPVVSDVILNGKKLKPMLGFYPVQIEALKALLKAVCGAHNIELKVPTDKDGNLVMAVDKRVQGRSFKGVVGHYHVTEAKADPAGLPLNEIVRDIQ